MIENSERLLVYLDGNENSYTAAQYAIYMAKTYCMDLFGVAIVKNGILDELMHHHVLLPAEKDEYLNDLNRDAQKHERQFQRMANEKGILSQTFVISGDLDTRKAIIDLIIEHNISCFVVGELPHLKSRTNVFYNEIEHLVYTVPCSVLIVKDPFRVEKLFDSV